MTALMENDPSAFLLILSQSSLNIASSQVFASTTVCAKTAGTEPIAKATEIKPAVKSVRRAIVGTFPLSQRNALNTKHAGDLMVAGLTGQLCRHWQCLQ